MCIKLYNIGLNSLPVSDIREDLKNGCKKADIPYGRFTKVEFIFHEFGHTANTNMIQVGVDHIIRMFIFVHSNVNDMDFRYDRIDD
jgi:hypothetical protein